MIDARSVALTAAFFFFATQSVVRLESVLVWPRSDMLFWAGDRPKKVSHFWAIRVYLDVVCRYYSLKLVLVILREANEWIEWLPK